MLIDTSNDQCKALLSEMKIKRKKNTMRRNVKRKVVLLWKMKKCMKEKK